MSAGPYREAMTLERLRDRFGRALSSRYGLRLHMTAMLALVLASGVLVARLLRPVTHSMPLRYAFAVAVAYGVFFVAMRVWARYVTDTLSREDVAVSSAVGMLGAHVAAREAERRAVVGTNTSADVIDLSGVDLPSGGSPGGGGGSGGGGGGFSFDADGEGVVVIVILALIALVLVVVFGAAVWCVWEAPMILGEVAFELLLASVLARAARSGADGARDWKGSLLRHTWKPALAVALVSVIAGAGVQAACPSVDTMRDAVQWCVVPYFSGHPTAAR